MYVLNSLVVRPAGNAPRQVRRRYSFLADVFPWLLFGLAEIFVLVGWLPWQFATEYTATVVKVKTTLGGAYQEADYQFNDCIGVQRTGKLVALTAKLPQPLEVGSSVQVWQTPVIPWFSAPHANRMGSVQVYGGGQLLLLVAAFCFGAYAWIGNENERLLLVNGKAAEAVAKNVLRRGVHWLVDYEFKCGGATRTGKVDLELADAVQIAKGTRMTVFFAPEKPASHLLYVTSRYVIEFGESPELCGDSGIWAWLNAVLNRFLLR
ncbi:MAG: hypothetical protein R3C18_19510 [Planctomycetaceae bacterium]